MNNSGKSSSDLSGVAATDVWQRAVRAAAVLAVDPTGLGGIDLRVGVGCVRDTWLDVLRAFAGENAIRKMPAGIDAERLHGGLDLAATLARNALVMTPGFLAEATGKVVLIAMAERLPQDTAAHLAGALDGPPQCAFVALDEGDDEERTPAALRDRLAIALDLRALTLRDVGGLEVHFFLKAGRAVPHASEAPNFSSGENGERALRASSDEGEVQHRDRVEWLGLDIAEARTLLPHVRADDAVISAFCTAAVALGIGSLRAPLYAVRVARCLAALEGRDTVSEGDAREAAALVLAPRATQLPAPREDEDPKEKEQERAEPEAPSEPPSTQQDMQALDDVVLDAAQAALPPSLLAQLAAGPNGGRSARERGKAGARQAGAQHGRRIGSRAGLPRGGAKLDLVATLRAAAPWQRLRTMHAASKRIAIRRDDFRIVRHEQRTRTTTIFLVDASGSSARERLAEAKGAVRLLLADCYIRRDEVALLAFRGKSADLLLPPTRSLVRAERALAALPGGGGTPLAAALDAAVLLAECQQRAGRTPTLVLMTDGRANVARDGAGGRARAHADALTAARAWRARNLAAALLDTSASPGPLGAEIAAAMGARYVPLPFADARGVSAAVRTISREAAR